MQELDRDLLAEVDALRAIHDAHAAGAQLIEHLPATIDDRADERVALLGRPFRHVAALSIAAPSRRPVVRYSYGCLSKRRPFFRELGVLLWDTIVAAAEDVRDAAALGPREFFRRAGIVAARVAGWCAASALAFVLVSAVVAAHHPGWLTRWFLTLMVLVVAPLALLSLPWVRQRRGVATAWSLVVAVAIVASGGRTIGGAVRRHGDWFLGQRTDTRAAIMRGAIAGTGALFEWFTAPPELQSHTLPPELTPRFYGPWRDGETPYAPEPVQVRWMHPLAEARRNLPAFESRRFGAIRPQPRPWECELGHCGVDSRGAAG